MTLLLRILFVIPLGFAAACFAAGFTMVAPILIGGQAPFAMNLGFSIMTAIFIAVSVGPLAAVPALVAVVFAEWFALRAFLFWALVGGAIGFTALNVGSIRIEGAWESGIGPLYVSAGLVGGAVYWLVAGRRSGIGFAPERSP